MSRTKLRDDSVKPLTRNENLKINKKIAIAKEIKEKNKLGKNDLSISESVLSDLQESELEINDRSEVKLSDVSSHHLSISNLSRHDRALNIGDRVNTANNEADNDAFYSEGESIQQRTNLRRRKSESSESTIDDVGAFIEVKGSLRRSTIATQVSVPTLLTTTDVSNISRSSDPSEIEPKPL